MSELNIYIFCLSDGKTTILVTLNLIQRISVRHSCRIANRLRLLERSSFAETLWAWKKFKTGWKSKIHNRKKYFFDYEFECTCLVRGAVAKASEWRLHSSFRTRYGICQCWFLKNLILIHSKKFFAHFLHDFLLNKHFCHNLKL